MRRLIFRLNLTSGRVDMRAFVCVLVVLLLVLHQDNWLWNDGTLVFGYMPVGLFYHACISVAAAVTWFLAIKFCWPRALQVVAEQQDEVT